MRTFDVDFDKSVGERDASLSEVSSAIDRVTEELQGLQTQLAELQATKAGIAAEQAQALSKPEAGYALLFELLGSSVDHLAARTSEMVSLVSEQQARVVTAMADETGVELKATYDKFVNETVPILHSLPEAYRPMLLHAHEDTIAKLKAHVDAARGEPVVAHGESVVVELAYAVDAPEVFVDLVILMVPVDRLVHSRWDERQEDLMTGVLARAVQAVYAAFHAVGVADAQCFFGDHNGMLVIEAEVPEGHDKSVGEVRTALENGFASTFSSATELTRAKLEVTAHLVDLEYLLPPEDSAPEEEAVPTGFTPSAAAPAGFWSRD